MKDYYYLFISGVTMQEGRFNFSEDMRKALGIKDGQWGEYEAAGSFQHHQTNYFEKYYAPTKGFFGRLIGKPLVYSGADALQYARHWEREVEKFSEFLKKETRDIIIVSHSLGSTLVMDYLTKEKDDRIKKVFAMANNSALFDMAPKDNQESFTKWYAFLEKNDVLSCPVGLTFPFEIEEIKVKIRHLLKGSNLAAHSGFWRSNKVHKLIKKRLP